jgi:integrase
MTSHLAPQPIAALHQYLRNSNLRQHSFKPILKRACLPSIRLYDLRHVCATLLLLADEPAKVVSERLGHSTITLTLDTYSHVLPNAAAGRGEDGEDSWLSTY